MINKDKLNIALEELEVSYKDIVEMANDIVGEAVSDVDNIINTISESMTNDDIRNTLLRLSMRAYSLGEFKEKATMKSELAETVRKQKYAIEFNGAEGSVAAKDNVAIISSAESVIVEVLYNLVSALLKTKLDEAHRCVDTLKTILMSRLSEAKLSNTLLDNTEI